MTLQLCASNIRKKYNGDQILRDCSFSFDEQGIYALVVGGVSMIIAGVLNLVVKDKDDLAIKKYR